MDFLNHPFFYLLLLSLSVTGIRQMARPFFNEYRKYVLFYALGLAATGLLLNFLKHDTRYLYLIVPIFSFAIIQLGEWLYQRVYQTPIRDTLNLSRQGEKVEVHEWLADMGIDLTSVILPVWAVFQFAVAG